MSKGIEASPFQFRWAEGWPFSQSVAAGELVYTAGQAGFDDDGRLVGPDFEAQLHQAFRNLGRVLEAHGAGLRTILRLNTYLSDRAQYATFKQIRSAYLQPPYPASTAVVVGFVFEGMLVEIEAVALRQPPP